MRPQLCPPCSSSPPGTVLGIRQPLLALFTCYLGSDGQFLLSSYCVPPVITAPKNAHFPGRGAEAQREQAAGSGPLLSHPAAPPWPGAVGCRGEHPRSQSMEGSQEGSAISSIMHTGSHAACDREKDRFC